jgi:uncharacterized protein YjlB
MSIIEDVKRTIEQVTGLGRPSAEALADAARRRKPNLFRFKDDGETPNNPALPLVVYRTPVRRLARCDAAAIFEDLFAMNGWGESWRDGVYPFNHFHTQTHECLGIARGRVTVQFGGSHGRKIELRAGDVVITPAGTGHRRLLASDNLLVVGAYPANGGFYDEPKPGDIGHDVAVAAIAEVKLPAADPVYGKDGPLLRHWRRPVR